MNPEFIRKNYERGLWSVAQVAVAAAKGIITAAQFEDITGVAYTTGGTLASPVADPEEQDATRYLLNSTGTTYHCVDCAKASTGSLKTLNEITASKPEAKPCATCNPPALTSV